MVTLATQLQDDFRTNVADLMRRRGVTQAQLADAIGVTQGYVSQLLNGRTAEKNGIGLDTVNRISIALSVAPHLLLKPARTKVSASAS